MERTINRSDTQANETPSRMELADGSQVAVIGGGPAGSFFSYFLLELVERAGRDVTVDIFEPRNFSGVGPASCNMCGGIISESLVQHLATEGINLPPTVVQRGIDSYTMHMDVGSVRIETPLHEMRIGAVHRAGGPRDLEEPMWSSFDGFLLDLAASRGARIVTERVEEITFRNGRPWIRTKNGEPEEYDLLAAAVGVNSPTLKKFRDLDLEYRPPRTTKTYICEYRLGTERLGKYLGNSMHVFLLDVPGLEFAAIIPKGDYASICLLGTRIDKEMIRGFLDSPEVKNCMPPDWSADESSCRCVPSINVKGAARPFGDRVVFIGDCGVARLYKDGIGAAYRTAKAAASTAVFQGVSASDFLHHYWPVLRAIEKDNGVGRFVFGATGLVKKLRFARRAVLRMIADEQRKEGWNRRMSMVMWDLFTGSATYLDIFRRALHPAFLGRLLVSVVGANVIQSKPERPGGRA
jgi:flavin-dependent dehydrogenase